MLAMRRFFHHTDTEKELDKYSTEISWQFDMSDPGACCGKIGTNICSETTEPLWRVNATGKGRVLKLIHIVSLLSDSLVHRPGDHFQEIDFVHSK